MRRSIFRARAVRRYAETQQKTVLPQFICPRAFLYLWILLGVLLLAGGLVTWLARGSLWGPVAPFSPRPTTRATMGRGNYAIS